jgi:hypothetical protein
MEALDKTDELKRINNAIAGVIKDLTAVADRIARIGAVAGPSVDDVEKRPPSAAPPIPVADANVSHPFAVLIPRAVSAPAIALISWRRLPAPAG